MDRKAGMNFQIKFKTQSSMSLCHEKHPGELLMLKEVLHNTEDSLDKVLVFQSTRLLSSVRDVYVPYSDSCVVYPYDRRVKHGKFVLKDCLVKKKGADPRFKPESQVSDIGTKSEPKFEEAIQIKKEYIR